jgi:ribonuclease P/MRP protein subunit RPP1|tara:strand:+ start:277 stop:711 length:435 start_codon:yes stop_codon:yes gene_type:complete
MIKTNNLNELRREIKKLKDANEEVVVLAGDDAFNRKVVENGDVDVIVGLEFDRRDFLKQRNSGLNEIMARLAKKNGIKIGVDVGEIKKLSCVEKARVLARLRQNIGLCKRLKVEMIVYPRGYGKEVMSLFLVLGSDSGLARNVV